MDEKDISVTMNNGVLTLKGEKKSERKEKKDNYHLMERSYGGASKSFRVAEPSIPQGENSFRQGRSPQVPPCRNHARP